MAERIASKSADCPRSANSRAAAGAFVDRGDEIDLEIGLREDNRPNVPAHHDDARAADLAGGGSSPADAAVGRDLGRRSTSCAQRPGHVRPVGDDVVLAAVGLTGDFTID
jgi:hypothetical protein